jgi:hypothetical protein
VANQTSRGVRELSRLTAAREVSTNGRAALAWETSLSSLTDDPGDGRSRRRIVAEIAFLAGAVGVLDLLAAPDRADAAASKLPQKAVAYQPTPKGKFRCDGCIQWEPPHGCKVVAGVIDPAGWCSVFAPKA